MTRWEDSRLHFDTDVLYTVDVVNPARASISQENVDKGRNKLVISVKASLGIFPYGVKRAWFISTTTIQKTQVRVNH